MAFAFMKRTFAQTIVFSQYSENFFAYNNIFNLAYVRATIFYIPI